MHWYGRRWGVTIIFAAVIIFPALMALVIYGPVLADIVGMILTVVLCWIVVLLLVHFFHNWIIEEDTEETNDYHALVLPDEESDMRERQA